MEEKHCINPNCEQVNPQPLDNFYSQNKYSKKRGNWIYHNPECKECTKKRTRKRQLDNIEEYTRKKKEYRRNRRLNDPEFAEAERKHANEMRKNDYQKEWQKKNPDKVKANNQYREMHKKHEIPDNEWEDCKKYFNHRCAYCGIKIEKHYITYRGKIQLGDFHKEHVNHNGANDLSNCVPSCRSCNSRKWKYEFEKWYSDKNPNYLKDMHSKIIKWLQEDYKLYIGK